MGRRDSRVEIDTERAPLIKLAFEEYSTGNWSLNSLSEHLTDLGLATPATPKLPSNPINKRMLHAILNNPYYKGIVTYNGVQYPGKHTPIIDEETWDQVQEILQSHINGERTRIHEHYLKSTVYCGKCGVRLIIHNAKSRSGDRYPYFVCAAKHNKRNDCKQRSMLIDEVAEQIEALYERISFSPEFRNLLQQWLTAQIDKLTETSQAEISRLRQQKEKLERGQRKLLQAHYADAIPLDLLKEEQERIGRSLKSIASQIEAYQAEYTELTQNLGYAFELIDDCGRVYRLADDYARRCLNQALFKKIRVHEDLTLDVDYDEPFDMILDPKVILVKSEFERNIQNANDGQPESIARHSLIDFIYTLNAQTSETIRKFFSAGLSKDILLQLTGPNLNHVKAALVRRSAILERAETPTNTIQAPHPYGEEVKMVREHKLTLKLLTPAEKDEVVAKYQAGMTMMAIADIYGCHYTTVGRLLRARGVEIR
jgi:DNA-directed RNA polymerase specialized sigma24 family protein